MKGNNSASYVHYLMVLYALRNSKNFNILKMACKCQGKSGLTVTLPPRESSHQPFIP